MKFWDASAIVPLMVAEESTRRLQALAAKDAAMLVWWGSVVECISALASLERDGALSSPAMTLALQRNSFEESRPFALARSPTELTK